MAGGGGGALEEGAALWLCRAQAEIRVIRAHLTDMTGKVTEGQCGPSGA